LRHQQETEQLNELAYSEMYFVRMHCVLLMRNTQ